ncbi:Xanthine/uracil/thiamine/ascorbate permease family protein [Paucilactobacillus wasatchensis]|uniref:Xanthine/uracil/thiamine/ascorbate permease family protein n=2 Tax=Paucilactobacillus wasatchensis TaxID=1335616 RepID=A0A0D0Y7W9_9LACO|nr:Xanthine/uracil/thiamine/ascorbate permease family protein [Paucilactobacillus wasatchensis]
MNYEPALLDRVFKLSEKGTTVKREIVAGITTFIAMSYILFVNPTVLAAAGMNKGAVFVATALTAIVGCVAMAFIANYPLAVAPGLGSNAFFSYSVVIGMGIPWQTAIAGVFIASILFMLTTVFKVREAVINAIPASLKSAMAAGIGLFIAFTGLKQGGLVIGSKSSLVTITNWSTPTVWLTVFGLVAIGLMMSKKIPGAMFIGMAATAIVGVVAGLIKMPSSIVSTIPSLAPTFGASILNLNHIFSIQMLIVVLIFFLVAFFDTTGTVIGLAEQAGFIKDNHIPKEVGRALFADSTSMIAGSVFGSTPTACYVESSTGIAAGGRTGLTALTVAFMFGLSLFFSPLLTLVTSQVTAPVLIIVGSFMAKSLAKVNWSKFEEALPSFLIVLSMPLTYNISYGLAFGILAYPLTMFAAGRRKEVHPIMIAAAIIFFFLLFAMNALPSS